MNTFKYEGERTIRDKNGFFLRVNRLCKKIPKSWYKKKELIPDKDFIQISSCSVLPLNKK